MAQNRSFSGVWVKFWTPLILGHPKNLTFCRQNIKFDTLGGQKMTHFWPKVGQFLAIFWTLFLAFLSPFHVEGSDLLVREMAQEWSKNGSKWPILGVSKNGHFGKTRKFDSRLSTFFFHFCHFFCVKFGHLAIFSTGSYLWFLAKKSTFLN